MVTLLMSYILMFPAFLKLRRIDSDIERPYKVPGGKIRLAIMTYLPMVLLIISVIFSIIPLSTDPAELSTKIPILTGTAVAILLGELLVIRSKRYER